MAVGVLIIFGAIFGFGALTAIGAAFPRALDLSRKRAGLFQAAGQEQRPKATLSARLEALTFPPVLLVEKYKCLPHFQSSMLYSHSRESAGTDTRRSGPGMENKGKLRRLS